MHVASLFVHPVKGCRAVPVSSARVEAWGLEGDRRWMVVDDSGRYQSQREVPRLATVVARLTDDGLEVTAPGLERLAVKEPEGPLVDVRVWHSEFEAVEASADGHAWFSELLGFPVRLVWLDDPHRRPPDPRSGTRATFSDGYPLLATSEGSLADLNARLERAGEEPVPMSRFRPNLVVGGADAWAEDDWTVLRLPGIELLTAKPCGRCVVTTTDQLTGERRGKQPLKILATFRLGGPEDAVRREPGPRRPGHPHRRRPDRARLTAGAWPAPLSRALNWNVLVRGNRLPCTRTFHLTWPRPAVSLGKGGRQCGGRGCRAA